MSTTRLVQGPIFLTLLWICACLSLFSAPAAQAQVSFVNTGFFTETVATLPAFTPVGVAFAPDGRLFIWQKSGVVRIVKNGQLLAAPFLDISAKVNHYQDRGLLGLALDPNFAANRYVYLLYVLETGTDPNDPQARPQQLTRVTADPNNPDVALPNSEVLILGGIPVNSPSHAIGMLRFAADGKLFVSVGDGAAFSNTDVLALRAQDLTSLNGKILRINPDGSAPSDNPFYELGNPSSNKSKVWAYGLRNPFRFALHPVTGSPSDGWPYFGDVGWNTWEEQNRGRGVNFGWPCYEGNFPQPDYQAAFPQCRQLSADSVTFGLSTYNHTVGNTAIGGAFYTGILYPAAYRGNYFFMDYGGRWIKRMVLDTNDNVVDIEPFASNVNGPVDLEMGPDGTLYYVALNSGEVGRIRWGTGNQPPVANATATPSTGYSPLTVNFSSAGSADPEGGVLTYHWDFGDGTTATAANPAHTYVQGGVRTFTATLMVTDPTNLSATATPPVTVGSTPPVAMIVSPTTGTKVDIGTTVTFQGTASDPDEGTLPGSALSWTVILHHNSHIHPLITATGSSGSFAVVDHGAGNYSFEVILTATDSSGLTNTTSVTLPVNNLNAPFAELDFTYSSREEMELAGWDFLAKTAGGATRDTEQSGALAVDYNQTAHPGVLRFPVGNGEIWQDSNNSQNMLLRDLPSDWVSIRLKLAVFNPVANYQQVGLLAYQDDDTYVSVRRNYNSGAGGPNIGGMYETTGVGTVVERRVFSNTGNVILRLDRDAALNTYSGYYSTDGGLSWVGIGSMVAELNNTRLGIQVGANGAGTLPVADLEWAQVLRLAAGPGVSGVTPSGGAQGQTLTNVVISGSNFQSGAICSFGNGVTVNSCMFTAATQLTANVTIAANATIGGRTVSVTNPDTQSGSLVNAFSVTPTSTPAPSMSGVTPSSGAQGQTLGNVVISGSNFVSGVTCSFGAGITVTSCTFTSATQLTANITIAANATVGPRTVSVTNPDTQSGSLANTFTVAAATVPAPVVSGVNPNIGAQGQTLPGVLINGNNFQSGAICSFGAGIAVTSCTFTSTTQLTANITIATNAITSGGYVVTVTNPDTQSGSLVNAFTVMQANGGTTEHFDFTAASSTALKTAGWDFVAKTATGVTRNTEQSGALAVDYNQTIHPGVLRFPISSGEIWQNNNNSQNMLLRNLPTDWTSLRLKISAFNPTADNQQVALIAYQNDDTYVNVRRNYNSAMGGPNIGSMYEVNGAVTVVQRQVLINTGNLILRLDRNLTTNAYSPLYSVDNGATWVALTGLPTVTLSNARVAIQVGSNAAGTLPVTDLAWVEILRSVPMVSGSNPNTGTQGQSLTGVVISGSNFQSGATCSFGSGITVNSCTFTSATQLTANVTIAANALGGGRTVTVTNPDTQSGSLANAFSVTSSTGGATQHVDLMYASSAALKADGWDFLAKTAAGATRNTEQSGALAVDYNQTTHPGVLRFPISSGEIWQSSNNSQNMLLRDLPSDWTSLRLKVAAFTPTADYQQVGLLVYQDDDTYVSVRRNYNSGAGGQNIGGMYETKGIGTVVERRVFSNTGNLILRLDRNLTTNAYSLLYSVDNGATWVALTGLPAVTLSNARVAIQIGSNAAGTLPVADLAWVEIVR